MVVYMICILNLQLEIKQLNLKDILYLFDWTCFDSVKQRMHPLKSATVMTKKIFMAKSGKNNEDY
jgi:hypothetical protein